jgi:hypothetical protein
MASALVVSLVKYGLLVLLWLFVLAVVRAVRSDVYGTRPRQAAPVGAPRPTATAAPADPRRRSSARKLVVTEGPLAGTSLSLGTAPVTLGRADESTLVLSDDYASNHHARLSPGDGAWLVEDLGSTNGTYLGAAKVVRPTPVPLGEPIRIGKTVLELRR